MSGQPDIGLSGLPDGAGCGAIRSVETMRPHPVRRILERLGRESVYLLLSAPVTLAAFVVLLMLTATGLALVIVWVGIPILLATAATARVVAQGERAVQRSWLGRPEIEGSYRAAKPDETGWQAVRRILTDPQRGLDLLFGLIAWVVSTVTWCVTVVWWTVALAGLLSPAWTWIAANSPSQSGWVPLAPYAPEVLVNVMIGFVAALTLPAVVHSLTQGQTQLFGAILGATGLQARVEHLQTSRDAAQDAEAGALRKLERDLHDGPQQRLVRLQMDLGRALTKLEDDPASARAAVESSMTQARDTLDELRLLSRGIASPVLLDRGLGAALEDLVDRSAIPARLTTNLHGRDSGIPERVQNATYYIVSEALTNAAKHSGAARVDVGAHLSEDMLRITVRDEGRGGAVVGVGTGLVGLRDRLQGLDGRLEVSSPPGGPTVLTALLPTGDLRG